MGKISVIAGIPWMRMERENLRIDPQPLAFNAAVQFAAAFREQIQRLLILCDTRGPFQNNLLLPGNRKRISRQLFGMDLDMFIPEVTEHFAGAADKAGIPLKDIAVVTRESLEGAIFKKIIDHERSETDIRREQRGKPGTRDRQAPGERQLLRTLAALIGKVTASKSSSGAAVFAQYDHRRLETSRVSKLKLLQAIRLAYEAQPGKEGKPVQLSFFLPRVFRPDDPEIHRVAFERTGGVVTASNVEADSDLIAKLQVPDSLQTELPSDMMHKLRAAFEACLRRFSPGGSSA